MFAYALAYRAINNDREEFVKQVNEVFHRAMTPGRDNTSSYLATLLLIEVEANRLGFNIMSPDEFRTLKSHLAQRENSGGLLDMITREEGITHNLASLQKPSK